MRRKEGRIPRLVRGVLTLLTVTFVAQACGPPGGVEVSLVEGSQDATPVQSEGTDASSPSRLAVLWTSGDREVALKVAFMYTLAAKRGGWFDEVTLIVWGPSSKLLSEDAELQAEVQQMADAGVEVVACKACADSYGVSDVLAGMGIDVKYMGRPLTDILKGDWEVITF
jgi:hypothetical protein